LVDTSVWIDFFNGVTNPFRACLSRLLEAEEDVCISDIILAEILQGFKLDKEFETAKKHLQAFPILGLSSPESYIQAAVLYRSCRKHGLTVRNTVDCLIAQTAIDHGVALLHNDRDFELISSVSSLQIFTSATL
jgi:hypothetical protein